MSSIRTILALTVPVGAVLMGLLWFFRRKDKPVDPPDRCNAVKVNEEVTLKETSSGSFSIPDKVTGNSNHVNERPDETASKPTVDDGQGIPISCEPVSTIKTKTKIIESTPADNDALSKSSVNYMDGSGDHNTEEQQIVEETITVAEVKQVECETNAVPLYLSPQDVESNSQLQNETVTSEQLQDVSAPPEKVLNGSDLDRVQNVLDDQTVADSEEACELSNNSLTRSWHEEVSEQCDNEANRTSDASDQMAKLQDSAHSPKPQHVKNGLPDETDHPVMADRLTKSPLGSDKKVDDAQTNSDGSSNCDNLSEASNDSGKGGSVTENINQSTADEERIYEFNIPSDMCGLFIGTRGKTVKLLRDQSGARIRLRNNPYTPDFQICIIEGRRSAIERALSIIKRKFPNLKYPGMDVGSQVPAAPVIVPEIMQLGLPEGVSVDIVVSSIVEAGRVFVQQPTHPSFPSLERLNAFMNQCYLQDGNVPDIPRPIESGVICAAPMLNGWYRAQIMAYYENSDECDIKYVDYGGYSHISSQCLKQIRSDFMTLPFEAVECYLGNITPLDGESYFSTEAAVVLEELTHGKLLQAQVVGRAEDGIPYVHIYQINSSNSALLVNREMVNRGVVRWLELMS